MTDNAFEKTVLSKEDYILALEGEVERLNRHILDERSIYETKLAEIREAKEAKIAEIRRAVADIAAVVSRSDISTSVANVAHFTEEIRRISGALATFVSVLPRSANDTNPEAPAECNPIPAGYVEMKEHIKRVEERIRIRDNELAACKAFLSTQGSLIADALKRSGGYYSLDDLVDSHLSSCRRLLELDARVSEMTDKVLAISAGSRETALETRISELEELVSSLKSELDLTKRELALTREDKDELSDRISAAVSQTGRYSLEDLAVTYAEQVRNRQWAESRTAGLQRDLDRINSNLPRTDPLAPDVAQARVSALVRNRINRESPGIATEARLAVCILNAVDQLSDVCRYFSSSDELSREGMALKAIELIGINIRSLFYSTTYPTDVSRLKVGPGPRVFGYRTESEKFAGLRKAILKASAFIASAASILEDVSGDKFDLFYDLANEEEDSDVWK